MRYVVLGSIRATAGATSVRLGGEKQRAALALLLVDPGRRVPTDRLIDGLWGDHPPSQARHTVQAYLSELRKLLDDSIERDGAGYRLALDPDQVDAARFEHAVEDGLGRLSDDPRTAAEVLQDSLGLWQGRPYADLAGYEVLDVEAHRLEGRRLVALEARLDADLALGRHRRIVDELDVLTRDHPFRERLWCQFLVALYRSGRQADALRTFQRVRELFLDELGIEPSSELRHVESMILTHDAALEPPARDPVTDTGDQSGRAPPRTDATSSGYAIRGYELRERVGPTPAGVRHRAYHAAVGREVTIERIDPAVADQPAFVERFEPAARRIGALDHPHIVPLLDHWRDPAGAYLVTPWAQGGTLRAAVTDGVLGVPSALRVVDEIGGALAHAHRAGIVHGALDASWVLLDGDGHAHLSGFLRVEAVLGAGDRTPEVSDDVAALALVLREMLIGTATPPGAGPVALDGGQDQLVDPIQRVIAAGVAGRFDRTESLVRALHRAAGTDVVAPVIGLDATIDGEGRGARRNPYKGLRAFAETDAADFHGREDVVAQMVDVLRAKPLLAVVGPSGVGKSSAVRAGLLPAIRDGALGSDRWLVTDMYPGTHPFEELGAALSAVTVDGERTIDDVLAAEDDRGLIRVAKSLLPDDDSRLILVIDQFEELYTSVRDPTVRQRFIANLVAAADDPRGRVRVVLTIRADFFDRPLQHHDLAVHVRAGLVTVAVPSTDQLARAITLPAADVGVTVAPGLVPAIVGDVDDQPGALPLLQHALSELFERRDGDALTAQAYRGIGGVSGALASRAEQVYESFPAAGQEAARQLMLRLVAIDEGGELVRRRIRRTEIEAVTGADIQPAVMGQVIQRFGAFRLLSFDRDPVTRGPTVEVAHEALFSAWPRLRSWIDGLRRDLLLHRSLTAAMRDWSGSGHDPSYLLSGNRLAEYDAWAAQTPLSLTDEERGYLVTSRERSERTHRARTRRALAVAGALVAVGAVAVTMGWLALEQRGAARAEQDARLAQEAAAASRASVRTDPELAVLLAEVAVDVDPADPAAIGALHEAVLAVPPSVRLDRAIGEVAWMPDGRHVVGTVLDEGEEEEPLGSIAMWQADTGVRVDRFAPDVGLVIDLDVADDGSILVFEHATDPDASVHPSAMTVLAPDGDVVATYDVPAITGRFAPGGDLLAVSFTDDPHDRTVAPKVALWARTGASSWRQASVLAEPGVFVEFSPDGTKLATAFGERVVVWDVATGNELRRFDDHGSQVRDLSWSPDGSTLAALELVPARVRIWDVDTGDQIDALPIDSLGREVAFDPGGDRLAVARGDGVIDVYHTGRWTPVNRLVGHRSDVVGIGWSPDGSSLASFGAEAGAEGRVWDLRFTGSHGSRMQTPFPVAEAAWTDDGGTIVLAGQEGGVAHVDGSDGTLDTSMRQADGARADVVLSPDGRSVAIPGPGFQTVEIRDLRDGQLSRTIEPGGRPLAFTVHGLLVGDAWTLRLVDPDTGSTTAELDLPPNREGGAPRPFDALLLADGRHVVVSTYGATGVWDLGTGGELRSFDRPLGYPSRLAQSDDGSLVAMADTAVRVWRTTDLLDEWPTTPSPLRTVPADAQNLAVDFAGSDTLVTGGLGQVLSVWDLGAGTRYTVDLGEPVLGVDAIPGDRLLLVGATVRVLDLDSQALRARARDLVPRSLTEAECMVHLGRRCAEV